MEAANMSSGLIKTLSDKVGAPEAAFRLLLTIIAGYPISFIYRFTQLKNTSQKSRHLYFALCGIFLCIFNYGFDTYHSLVSIWITYVLVRLLYSSPLKLIIINMTFHMLYLSIGYYFTESNEYDILWTMPHCILVLRMIGYGFDIADGRKTREKLSKDQQENALEEIPSLLELTAFAYFPLSFIVGPQFSFRRYKRFISGEFDNFKGSIQAGLKRMTIGIIYLGVRQIGALYLPDDYFLTDAFRNEAFIKRLLYLGLWGKLALYKYVSCWLLTEGALMCLGFTYAGSDENGKPNWFGCSNVKLMILETGFTMQHYVQSFNVNTNHWVAAYVYKRLKFFNNRTVSYAAALGFLAIWHGFHSGYYMSFFIEYMIVTLEKQIESAYNKIILTKYPSIESFLSFKYSKVAILKTYNIVFMGWCLTPFIFLKYARWIRVFSAVNYFGFIYIAIWLVVLQLLKYLIKDKSKDRPKQVASPSTSGENEKNE